MPLPSPSSQVLSGLASMSIAGDDPTKPRAIYSGPGRSSRGARDLRASPSRLRHGFASVGVGASLGLPIIGRALGASVQRDDIEICATRERGRPSDPDDDLRVRARTVSRVVRSLLGDPLNKAVTTISNVVFGCEINTKDVANWSKEP